MEENVEHRKMTERPFALESIDPDLERKIANDIFNKMSNDTSPISWNNHKNWNNIMKNTTVPEPFLTEEENNERIIGLARESAYTKGFVHGVLAATIITLCIIFFM